ncbi:hypothetical protein [Caballeronia zhejiangensis]|uniref:hypothetical protein n=1 Tax=Caballeronia zhejiangensis TaxID=871203 RepID=UPI00158F4F77|nr:hypothetical protein [Caballeronia zhejiangensis]
MSTFSGTIKMALATKADEDVAYDLVNLLEAIDRGDCVAADVDGEAEEDWFDEDDINHHKALHARLKKLADKSGALWRILGGWSCVTNPDNKLLDLTQSTVEFHPRIAAADELLEVAREALHVIRAIKPPENGNGTIVRLEDAIAKATGEKA